MNQPATSSTSKIPTPLEEQLAVVNALAEIADSVACAYDADQQADALPRFPNRKHWTQQCLHALVEAHLCVDELPPRERRLVRALYPTVFAR